MTVDGIDWFKSQVPGISSCRLPNFHLTQTGYMGCPMCEYNILEYFNQLSNSCCFHKLAHMHLNTIHSALKHNKKGNKAYRSSENDPLVADLSDTPMVSRPGGNGDDGVPQISCRNGGGGVARKADNNHPRPGGNSGDGGYGEWALFNLLNRHRNSNRYYPNPHYAG